MPIRTEGYATAVLLVLLVGCGTPPLDANGGGTAAGSGGGGAAGGSNGGGTAGGSNGGGTAGGSSGGGTAGGSSGGGTAGGSSGGGTAGGSSGGGTAGGSSDGGVDMRSPPHAGVSGHPGFLLNTSEIQKLRLLIQVPGVAQTNWLSVKQQADYSVAGLNHLGQPLVDPLYLDWRTTPHLRNMRYVGQPVSALGMAYAMTSDRVYSDRAANILRAFRTSGGVGGGGVNGFDGITAGFVMAFLFTYDLIYHSGSLSAQDKQDLESWFRSRVAMGFAQAVHARGGGHWSEFHGIRRYYLAPEDQIPLFYVAALGFLLEDPSLISFGVSGNGYPFAFDDHQAIPTATQNPYSFQHFVHDNFLPSGAHARLLDRVVSPLYSNAQMLAAQLVMQAAWQRGVDLWRYRDPTTDNHYLAGIDWQARSFKSLDDSTGGLTVNTGDGVSLFFLPYSHFRTTTFRQVIDYSNPYWGNPRTGWEPQANTHLPNQNYLGAVLTLISLFDRSSAAPPTGGLPGPLTSVPNDRGSWSVQGAVAFQVSAPNVPYRTGQPIPLTIRALQANRTSTATGFSGTVQLFCTSWSAAIVDYTVIPGTHPSFTVLNPALDPSPSSVTFSAADQGVKTIHFTVRQAGVGTTFRVEAIVQTAGGSYFPFESSPNLLAVRGYSNRLTLSE